MKARWTKRQQACIDFYACGEARDAVVRYVRKGGHSGPGWYVWCGEYPEEGSEFLGRKRGRA